MSFLWDKPAQDPDWIMNERLQSLLVTVNDPNDVPAEVMDALRRVYYDVFNNDGCNLPHNAYLAVSMMLLQEYAKTKGYECPDFVWVNDGDYDTVALVDMDQFARLTIRHLYLDVTER